MSIRGAGFKTGYKSDKKVNASPSRLRRIAQGDDREGIRDAGDILALAATEHEELLRFMRAQEHEGFLTGEDKRRIADVSSHHNGMDYGDETASRIIREQLLALDEARFKEGLAAIPTAAEQMEKGHKGTKRPKTTGPSGNANYR